MNITIKNSVENNGENFMGFKTKLSKEMGVSD